MLIALTQTFYTWRYGAKFMLAMVIGAYSKLPMQCTGVSRWHTAYAVGFGFRFALHYHPDSRWIYTAEYFFIVLSVRPFMQSLSQWLIEVCVALCIHRSRLCLARTSREAYIMHCSSFTTCA